MSDFTNLLYPGGKEHAYLHLYFARFISHFLHSINLLGVKEPFSNLITQGMVKGQSYRIKVCSFSSISIFSFHWTLNIVLLFSWNIILLFHETLSYFLWKIVATVTLSLNIVQFSFIKQCTTFLWHCHIFLYTPLSLFFIKHNLNFFMRLCPTFYETLSLYCNSFIKHCPVLIHKTVFYSSWNIILLFHVTLSYFFMKHCPIFYKILSYLFRLIFMMWCVTSFVK